MFNQRKCGPNVIEIGNNSQVALCQKTKQHKIKLRWLEPDEGDPRLQKKKKKRRIITHRWVPFWSEQSRQAPSTRPISAQGQKINNDFMAPFGSQEENGEATTIIINDKEEKSFFFLSSAVNTHWQSHHNFKRGKTIQEKNDVPLGPVKSDEEEVNKSIEIKNGKCFWRNNWGAPLEQNLIGWYHSRIG